MATVEFVSFLLRKLQHSFEASDRDSSDESLHHLIRSQAKEWKTHVR